jgi:hypothetical protein
MSFSTSSFSTSSNDPQVPACERDFLTIVSGLPRSGTSMMMSILRAGGIPVMIDEVRKADEDNPRGYFELEAVKRTKQDASWLTASHGKAVKMVYRLLRELPDQYRYRVVFMQRDLGEIHASQEAMLERLDKKSQSMQRAEFERIFAGELKRILSWTDSKANFETLEVSYAETVASPRPQTEAISTFLGGGLDIDAMQAAVEPTLYRKRA